MLRMLTNIVYVRPHKKPWPTHISFAVFCYLQSS